MSIVATLSQTPQYKAKRKSLRPPGSSAKKEILGRSINFNTVIKHPDDLEDAVTAFMEQVYIAETAASPNQRQHPDQSTSNLLPQNALVLIQLKRRVRRKYTGTGDMRDYNIYKRLLNRLSKVLKKNKQDQNRCID